MRLPISLLGLLLLVACGTPRSIEEQRALLASPDPRVRVDAAKELGRAGPPARVAEVELREGLAAEHPEVRRWSAYALGEVSDGSPATVKALAAQLLADDYLGARHGAAGALARLAERCGAPALQAGDALVRALDDPAPAMRPVVLLALRKLAASTPGGVRVLARALDHPDPQVRLRTAIALGRLGPDAIDALHPLTRASIEDPDPNVRAAADAAVRRVREKR